jgi:tRNA (adenine37-N6)-methyltransferase
MFNFHVVARIKTEFSDKFGVPKQSQLAPALEGRIIFEPQYRDLDYLRGLEKCSHLWLIFVFHLVPPFQGSTIRPPLLGGKKRLGVFSTRTPHRPNPIGLSLVEIKEIDEKNCEIIVTGHDLVNDTPLIDIKPYINTYDCPSGKSNDWTQEIEFHPLEVEWLAEALSFVKAHKKQEFKDKVEQLLRLDPRPRTSKDSQFGFYLEDCNVEFRIDGKTATIISVSYKK